MWQKVAKAPTAEQQLVQAREEERKMVTPNEGIEDFETPGDQWKPEVNLPEGPDARNVPEAAPVDEKAQKSPPKKEEGKTEKEQDVELPDLLGINKP